jgi:hypothetical protein
MPKSANRYILTKVELINPIQGKLQHNTVAEFLFQNTDDYKDYIKRQESRFWYKIHFTPGMEYTKGETQIIAPKKENEK